MLLLIITLVFPRLTFIPLLSKASFRFRKLFPTPSIVSLVRTKSSAYGNSLSACSLANSFFYIYHNCKQKMWQHRSLAHPHFYLALLWELRIHCDSCFCSFIQTHHWYIQNLWYSFLPQCQLQHFPWYSVKSFLLVHNTHILLFYFSMILFLLPFFLQHDTLLASFSR